MKLRLLTTLVFCLANTTVQAWTPPQGIPAPPIGGAVVPVPAYTIYVNETTGNDANPGTSGSPRKTIPNNPTAGSSISVTGVYNHCHNSPNDIEANGTVNAPIYITGGVFGCRNDVSGTYLILTNTYSYTGWNFAAYNGVHATHHLLLQDSYVDGSLGVVSGSGYGGIVFQATDDACTTCTIADVVVIRCYIHNLGYPFDPEDDNDFHGTSTFRENVSNVWVLDSTIVRVSGDGIQVNGTNRTNGASSMHHVYFGHNVCQENRQTCAWAKESSDSVFSSNVCSLMRPGSGGPGICFGGQYNPIRLVILKNAIFNSEIGIRLASYTGGATGGGLIAGNLIFNIHCTTGCTYQDGFSNGAAIAIIAGGSVAITISNNTINDTDYGLVIGTTPPTILNKNNIYADVDTYELGIVAVAKYSSSSGWNLYETQPTFNINGTIGLQSAAQRDSVHSKWGDPLFHNELGNDYHLEATSPGANAGDFVDLDSFLQAHHGTVSGVNTLMIGALGVTSANPPPIDPDEPPPAEPPNGVGPSCTCGSIVPG